MQIHITSELIYQRLSIPIILRISNRKKSYLLRLAFCFFRKIIDYPGTHFQVKLCLGRRNQIAFDYRPKFNNRKAFVKHRVSHLS